MAYRKLPRGTRQKISEYFEHRYQVKILFIHKGGCQKRFSGIRPLRGYPPPTALTENQSEKKKVFFLSGKGGDPPPPLTESPLSFSGIFFPKRAKNDVFFIK